MCICPWALSVLHCSPSCILAFFLHLESIGIYTSILVSGQATVARPYSQELRSTRADNTASGHADIERSLPKACRPRSLRQCGPIFILRGTLLPRLDLPIPPTSTHILPTNKPCHGYIRWSWSLPYQPTANLPMISSSASAALSIPVSRHLSPSHQTCSGRSAA